jgi:hypothetical protein
MSIFEGRASLMFHAICVNKIFEDETSLGNCLTHRSNIDFGVFHVAIRRKLKTYDI